MLLLGIDLGTSSIKVSIVDSTNGKLVASAQYPEVESPISSPQAGWAEQDPEMWWKNTQMAIEKAVQSKSFDPYRIAAIGISYQMHGLVIVDKNNKVLRPSIIWCDSRAVIIGQKAFDTIGHEQCLSHLLNSPGNFTASKLAWVKENEPEVYEKIDKIMLPGDYLALRLTNDLSCSNSSLSEGIFWDFQTNTLSEDILKNYGFSKTIFPEIRPVFSEHGQLNAVIAGNLGLRAGIPITYKAGDQPNNALSLNVLEPGEVAATAGTSGVVYAVTDKVAYDPQSRVNTFAHVNHRMKKAEDRLGILLCVNGTGILNRWLKDNLGNGLSYSQMNGLASESPIGSNGLTVLPFGNGAERIFNNQTLGAKFSKIDFNIHSQKDIFRASQEGIAFSLKYGMDIMSETGNAPKIIRAGKANMFLSSVFAETIVNASQVPVELYDTDGSKGAALGAGIGLGIFANPKDAFVHMEKLAVIEPNILQKAAYEEAYENWKKELGV
ncbi:MAG: FGGY family carbohydrate kinase [Bacteroidota bacterium]